MGSMDPLLERIADALAAPPRAFAYAGEEGDPGGRTIRVDFGDGLTYDVTKDEARARGYEPGKWRDCVAEIARARLRESYGIPAP